MNKQEFLTELQKSFFGLPQDDVKERVAFYQEMIDDRIEAGMSEEEAISEIGTVDEIRKQIIAEIPFSKLVKEKFKPKRSLRAWEIVLIVLGFPVWFSLIVAAGAIIFSLYVVVWALIFSLWAIEISFWACALCGIAATVIYFAQGGFIPALMMLGAALLIAGLSIFLFFGCIAAFKGTVKLTKKSIVGVKYLFIRKENAK